MVCSLEFLRFLNFKIYTKKIGFRFVVLLADNR